MSRTDSNMQWIYNGARYLQPAAILPSDQEFNHSIGEDMFSVFLSATAAGNPISNETTQAPAIIIEGEEYIDDWANSPAMLFTPRIAAIVSLFAIACVTIEAWKDLCADKQRSVARSTRIRSSTSSKNVSIISRIQLFYQVPLFCYSLALALGPIPAPMDQNIWGAVGNLATCDAQGFLLQFGLFGLIGWDTVLSTTYLMMVRYKVGNSRLQNNEKYYHLVIWSAALVASIIPLAKGMNNFNNTLCWLESYPDNCTGDECLRGEGAVLWQNLASLATMLQLIYSISMMVCLYCSIRGLENTRQQYVATSSIVEANDMSTSSASEEGSEFELVAHREEGSTVSHNTRSHQSVAQASVITTNTAATTNRQHSRAVGFQGILYASGMVCTMSPTAFYIVLFNTTGLWSTGFAIFATSIVPLVGYVNFIMFMRGRPINRCHTRYAKFLRKMHSCLFDRYWLSSCCRRQGRHWLYPCCQTGRAKDDANAAAAAAAAVTAHHQHNSRDLRVRGENHDQNQIGEQPNTQANLPVINENCLAVESLEDNGTHGRWTGFMINVKKRGKQVSQWMSELGVSSVSENDDLASACDFDGGCDNDRSPMAPMRLGSQAERPPTKPMRLTSQAERPPTKPMRVVSEMSELHNSSVLDYDDRFENRISVMGGAPPMRPDRVESSVLDSSSSQNMSGSFGIRRADIPMSKPQRQVSDPDVPYPKSSLRRAPPTKPERYLSEGEAPDLESSLSRMKPERYESEIEVEDLNRSYSYLRQAPVLPERYVSELEQSFSLDHSFSVAPPTIQEECSDNQEEHVLESTIQQTTEIESDSSALDGDGSFRRRLSANDSHSLNQSARVALPYKLDDDTGIVYDSLESLPILEDPPGDDESAKSPKQMKRNSPL